MSPDARDIPRLWDMLAYARQAIAIVADATLEQYRDDVRMRLAVERCIEIVGEAANRVSPETRRQHPAIPWRAMIGQRHVLAHEYGGIDDARLWRVATVNLPALVRMLVPLLPGEPPDPSPRDRA